MVTSSSTRNGPVVIVDHLSGRGFGGHIEDYLLALEHALSDREPQVIAPFRDGRAVPRTRAGMYRLQFSDYRRALKIRGGVSGAVIVHTSELSDYISCFVAASTIRRSRRNRCLFMLRRGPSPAELAVGSVRLGRLLINLVTRMIRRGVIIPTSDSRPALDAWEELSGSERGVLVALPPAPGSLTESDAESATGALIEPEGPLIAIAGRMRGEKGAASYPDVVSAALTEFPEAGVAIQVSGHDRIAETATAQLQHEYENDARVQLLDEHLSSGAYQALLKAADIVVLPYTVAAYGTGTSGVIGDALSLGASVVVTPIKWARDTFGDDPRVVWLDDPPQQQAIRDAIRSAVAISASSDAGEDAFEKFSASWHAALSVPPNRTD